MLATYQTTATETGMGTKNSQARAPHFYAGPTFSQRNGRTEGGGTPRPAPLWVRKTLVKGRWVPERDRQVQ
jgi:hypothetical protein